MEERSTQSASGQTPFTHTTPQAISGPRPRVFAFLRPAEAPDEVGRLGGFRLLGLLGEGGMGLVFLAEDLELGRQVAVKVMKPETAYHEDSRRRFLREARATAAVQHDHIVSIHEVDEDGGVPFLVMPLLKGESLESRLRRRAGPFLAEAVRIARDSAEGLAAAHAAGLVHRDVKPSNLWLEPTPHGERVKVLDFGLARPVEDEDKLTRTNALLGTAGYMAPEQARAEAVDARADLFSLGCVLYRLLTGRPPFQGKTLSVVLLQVETYHPPAPRDVAPGVPVELSDLVMRLLSKDPSDRPASARETADALRGIERSLPAMPAAVGTAAASQAGPPSTRPTGPAGRPGNKGGFIASLKVGKFGCLLQFTLMGLLLIVGLPLVTLWSWQLDRNPRLDRNLPPLDRNPEFDPSPPPLFNPSSHVSSDREGDWAIIPPPPPPPPAPSLYYRLEYHGSELDYAKNIPESAAKRLADYLEDDDWFPSDHPVTVQLDKPSDSYQVRFCVKPGATGKADVVALYRSLCDALAAKVFPGSPVEVHLCDKGMNTVRVIRAGE